MEGYDPAEAAQRSGIGVDELDRLVELGILTPTADGRFTPGHLRRAALVKSLAASGISLEGLGAVIRRGQVSLDFLDAPAFERFSALSGVTFAQLAERTGVPVELLMRIREATGSVAPQPDDRVRDEELACAEMIEAQFKAPAHVGLHAGPVIFQEGDYYGQTVNLASRIADYAQAGDVIVSQEVVDASNDAPVAFRDVGAVELKGVPGARRLFAAARA